MIGSVEMELEQKEHICQPSPSFYLLTSVFKNYWDCHKLCNNVQESSPIAVTTLQSLNEIHEDLKKINYDENGIKHVAIVPPAASWMAVTEGIDRDNWLSRLF